MNLLRRHRALLRRAVGLLGLALSGWLIGTPLSLQAASSVGVGVSVRILNPPNAVNDLSASAVGSQDGDAQLVWTAPANANGAPLDHYIVRFATYPAGGTGAAAEAWWAALSANQVTFSAHAAGATEFGNLTGLSVGTTYYFGVKSIDVDAQQSSIDSRVGTAQQAKCQPVNVGGTTPPATPGGFAGIAVSSTNIQWSWSASSGASFYMLNAFPSGALVQQTSALNATETGLSPNTAVSRTLKAGNSAGLSAATSVQTVYTLATVPSTPTVVSLNVSHIEFSWNANSNPSGTQYRIFRSLDGTNFTPLTLTTTASYNDGAVTEGTSYYYRVTAINGDGVSTSASGILFGVPHQTDFLAPAEPLGLKGVTDAQRQFFTLTWEPVTQNVDGTPASDIVGYHVYRRTLLNGSPVRITTTPTNVAAFADQVNGLVYYYTIRTVDSAGNLSTESLFADSSPETNIIYVGPDGESSLTMPGDVNGLLRSTSNSLGVPLTIRLEELPVSGDVNEIRKIRLDLIRGDTRQPVSFSKFQFPKARIAISYAVQNGEVVRGSPLAVNAAAARTGITADKLSMFWNNGATLIKVGGVVNEASHTLQLNTSVLGEYQIRVADAASTLNLDKASVYPRLITPNGDGKNDRVFFVLENPNDVAVQGVILDKDGRFVVKLPDPSVTGGVGTTMVWDGRDASGNVVPGGVYIYKIDGEGHSFTGTVGVAR